MKFLLSHLLLFAAIVVGYYKFDRIYNNSQNNMIEKENHVGHNHRRLQSKEGGNKDRWFADVPHILNLATQQPQTPEQLRVLLVVTTLVEYDKGTRGTKHGYDRLQHVVLTQLVDSVTSMVNKGWSVDVYLVLGFETLEPNRKQMIIDALPNGVGLEYWESAIPYHYSKTYNHKPPRVDQKIEFADHALSRQHRFVLRDKLSYYDFFACFVSIIFVLVLLLCKYQASNLIAYLNDICRKMIYALLLIM